MIDISLIGCSREATGRIREANACRADAAKPLRSRKATGCRTDAAKPQRSREATGCSREATASRADAAKPLVLYITIIHIV